MEKTMYRSDNERVPPATTEIEVKVLEINRSDIEERLNALGAVKIFDGPIHALYYDLPDQRLKSDGLALRLRLQGTKVVLTLKADIANADAKERQEFETEVGDFEIMRKMLETMGFSVWLEMKKLRTSYALPFAHIEIDRYTDDFGFIPEFLEIEGGDMQSVYRAAESLGFSKQDCRPWDAVQLAAYYREPKDSLP